MHAYDILHTKYRRHCQHCTSSTLVTAVTNKMSQHCADNDEASRVPIISSIFPYFKCKQHTTAPPVHTLSLLNYRYLQLQRSHFQHFLRTKNSTHRNSLSCQRSRYVWHHLVNKHDLVSSSKTSFCLNKVYLAKWVNVKSVMAFSTQPWLDIVMLLFYFLFLLFHLWDKT